jgi:multidrug efflux system membrane fusion protein
MTTPAARRPARRHRLAGLLLPLLAAGCAQDAPAPEPVRPAMVARAQADGTRVEVFPGVVRARWESPLAFRVAGKLAGRAVEVGDRVTAGQRLAELDPDDARLQVAAVRAQRMAAQADLELAAAERDRHRAMFERQLISASAYQARQTQHEAARARLEQLDAQLAATRNQAGYTTLEAGHDGVVTALHAEVGQVLAAGQPVVTVAREDALEVLISLPEQRRGEFAAGDDAAVELWAREGERVAGQVREIAPQADPQTRTYAARVAFDAGGASWLGQTARVYFLRQGGSGLSVPLSALHADQGQPALWVVDPATRRVALRPVEIGPYGETRVPVLSGLGPEEWIVTAGVHLLREGQAIVPIDRDNRRLDLAQR